MLECHLYDAYIINLSRIMFAWQVFFCKFWNPTLIETLVFSSGQVKAEVEGALYIGGSLLAFAGWLVAAFGWHLSGGWGWCSCQLWFWERRHEKEAYLCSWEGWKAETQTLFSRTSPYSTIQTLNTQLLSFWHFSTFPWNLIWRKCSKYRYLLFSFQ